jgi:hypothetical protein
MSWLKKLLLMRSSLRLPWGTGGGFLVWKCFSRPALAACLLLTLSSPSLEDEGRKKVSSKAALGGAFRWFRLRGGRRDLLLELAATK